MHEAVPAIAACGVSPVVRIPDNQGFMVKREPISLPQTHSKLMLLFRGTGRRGSRDPRSPLVHSGRREEACAERKIPA